MTLIGETDGTATVADQDGRVRMRWGARTDTGHHRAANEDSLVLAPPLFAVADGMGGHAAGDAASALAVRRLADAVPATAEDAEVAVTEALDAAAADVDALSDELGVDAGTTATGVVVLGDRIVVFNVGDSRVYGLIEGRLHQLTVDHSVVQELIDSGHLDPDEAETHPAANVITRALGFHERPEPDLVRIPIDRGLRVLVCSDGLSREVDHAHLRLLVGAALSPEDTAGALVDAALAAGGRDNVSVIVLDVEPEPEPGIDPGTASDA